MNFASQPERIFQTATRNQEPPPPPKNPEPVDPHRQYGNIATGHENGDVTNHQEYSYLTEGGRQVKSAFLRSHPEFKTPPGDPISAPKDREIQWDRLTGVAANGNVIDETYWYEKDDDRERIKRLLRGEE
jgi:hypothetical protein